MEKTKNIMGVKPRTSKQIVNAGLTLGVGMLVLPLAKINRTDNDSRFL
jgi:hypothetical protein